MADYNWIPIVCGSIVVIVLATIGICKYIKKCKCACSEWETNYIPQTQASNATPSTSLQMPVTQPLSTPNASTANNNMPDTNTVATADLATFLATNAGLIQEIASLSKSLSKGNLQLPNPTEAPTDKLQTIEEARPTT